MRPPRGPVAVAALCLLLLVLAAAVAAPPLWGARAAAVDTTALGQGPSASHWLGTDELGRDVLLRVLVATRLSVSLAFAATAISVGVGVLLGASAVLLGERAGRFVAAAVQVAVAFPGLLTALFFAVVFGVGARGAVLAIGLAGAPAVARLTQTLVARVWGQDFIAAARLAGVGRWRMLVRHVLPNVGEPLIVNAAGTAGAVLPAFAGLSFLGLGVQAPSYDWGRLLADGLSTIYLHPAVALAPGVAVVVAALAFNLTGEALAAQLRPTARPLPRVPAVPSPPPPPSVGGPLLEVSNLRVAFPGAEPVRGVSFTIAAGEAVGVVGESGSGKSLTALGVARLIEEPGRVTADRLNFDGAPVATLSDRWLGSRLAMVFQNPMTSFNPALRMGAQLTEVARRHTGLGRRPARDRAIDRLREVGLRRPETQLSRFPHELSGGMLQRAMIGMGLMAAPALIIADEPTTALDAAVRHQILDLLDSVRRSTGAALLLISHDIGVVRRVCDRVLVMYAGRIVEDVPATALHQARHPYTQALIGAMPDMATDRTRPLTVIPGRPPDPASVPPGCAFADRCARSSARCRQAMPELDAGGGCGHRVACWHADRPLTRSVPS
ncbi:dipeptide/oligopeptide/nickel ABC transporter permease/ATP-binding protein [Catenuloplanes atrovinosus]|uniref:Oligopeptide/dipeptide ABC transporter ATP-binding protein n=1 Tax=Catenuloplanes atrovinosus TaxID=137266 RepID=A0AAE3YRZ1_9ACTN|nr:dipeptide/oligopeptide/nickel ABC transporter permease/ATP-binding protein [Catenuloplanes atrovinosus]MDR7277269.1 oligopeptide/dipeptide ABC transporter ATP-binding protein [Catenuloplanes atrovinosus]